MNSSTTPLPDAPANGDGADRGNVASNDRGAGSIGRYRIVGRLGVGGMGEVLLARSSGAGGFEKDVVIKRILPHLATDPDFVLRFIEEGKLVVKLRHAGIAQVLDMGVDGGVVFIAMEHVDGKDLSELLKLAGMAGLEMPRELVIHVLIELLEALDYAHHAVDTDGSPLGLIHRDVTPSNVMISKSGEVKLLDFGIARATERLKTSVSGAIRGKYSYMSPQQAAGLELDPRSDLFSVGVIAWELLAGTRPFDGASDLLTLDRVRTFDPGPLAAAAPNVSPELSDWVSRMLSKTPDERFASAHDAARALRKQLMALGVMPSGRELSGWYDDVVAVLPDGLKDRPVQGLSLDEVLLMGLGPEQRGPGTVVAAQDAPLGSDVMPVLATDEAEPKKSRGFAKWLIAVNLVLIAAVVVLVVQLGNGANGNGEAGQVGEVGGGGDPMALTAGGAAVAAVVLEDGAATEAAATESDDEAGDASVAPEIEPEVLASVAPEPVVEPPMTAGGVVGEVLGELPSSVLEGDLEMVIRSQPPGASIAVNGLGIGVSPRTIRARRGVVITGRATLADHQARTFELEMGQEDSHLLAMRPVPRGVVRFRFFPAEGTRVEIDGRPMSTASNVVSAELAAGKHTLVLVSKDGKRLVRQFVIEEGQTTNIGTLDLARGE